MQDSRSLIMRVNKIEDALASALRRGDFEVIAIDGERFLQPVMQENGIYIGGRSYPILSLYDVAREMERLLHG